MLTGTKNENHGMLLNKPMAHFLCCRMNRKRLSDFFYLQKHYAAINIDTLSDFSVALKFFSSDKACLVATKKGS
jgi:hypothetical protein